MHTAALVIGLMALFAAIMSLVVGLAGWSTRREQVGRSLAVVRALRAAPGAVVRRDIDRPFAERVIAPTLSALGKLGRRFSPRDESGRLRHKLELAGNPARWDVDRLLAFKMLGLVAGLTLGLAIPIALGAGLLVTMGVTILLSLLGVFGPDIVLYQLAYNRTERLRRELPDSIDLLTISVEAGLPFESALAQVARNTSGQLADELFRVLQEMQIGRGRAEALRALTERTNLPELRGFVTALLQAETFGIPIANVLRIQAREMRQRRSQRAEESAQKVPVKILFPLIFCVLPALFVVVMGPAAINIFNNLVR